MDSTQLEVQITEFSICASDLYGRAVLDMSTESHLLFKPSVCKGQQIRRKLA